MIHPHPVLPYRMYLSRWMMELSDAGVTPRRNLLPVPDSDDPELVSSSVTLNGPSGMSGTWSLQFPINVRVFEVSNKHAHAADEWRVIPGGVLQ